MSTESVRKRTSARRTRRIDRGMTLPELLIVISLMGILAAVVSVAITVTFRSARSAEGRINVARAEQNIDVWLPADLASTDVTNTLITSVESTDATVTPCGNCGTIDLSGANALQLAWTSEEPGATPSSPPVTVLTKVQYQYINVAGEWQMQRIECVGSAPCRMAVVLHDLPGPQFPATPANYSTIVPTWVMRVDEPPAPSDPSLALSAAARRVVVTINGGGEVAGAGGGENSVSLTAGGRVTDSIAADEFTVPSFVRARSRCGGPISLLVDTSGSIGSVPMNSVVVPGVKAFIEAFRDTPTQIQVVEFGSRSRPMGASSDWHKYVDMTDSVAVTALLDEVDVLTTTRRAGTRTNWEEGFFRALYNDDATSASTYPNRIVFFTDGVPTVHRNFGESTTQPQGPYIEGDALDINVPYNTSIWTQDFGSTGYTDFNQESFDRTDAIVRNNLSADYIFVGVGSGLNSNRDWIQNTAAYTDPNAPLGPTESRTGEWILDRLMDAAGGSVEATPVGGPYTNADTANFYVQDTFNATNFANAMRAAALKDCGGTLTLQTRLLDGTSVADEFVYENTEYRNDVGTPIVAAPRRVTTSATFKTGTFDYEIDLAQSAYYTTDIVPQELGTLAGYTFDNWSCRAGATPRVPVLIDLTDPTFKGISVEVGPNEAVSCILTVDTP